MKVNAMQRQNEIVYTVNDLMDILQVSRRTILKYIKEKRIKAFKLGYDWRITKKHLDEFIEDSMK